MDPLIYKILHLLGVMMLFTGVSALLSPGADGSWRKPGLVWHGMGLLLLLLGGFGMLAKFGKDAPAVYSYTSFWVLLKFAVWLFFGATIVLAKRGMVRGPAGWWLCLLAGGVAAWAALFKPFL